VAKNLGGNFDSEERSDQLSSILPASGRLVKCGLTDGHVALRRSEFDAGRVESRNFNNFIHVF
jgi:hypothetical protein